MSSSHFPSSKKNIVGNRNGKLGQIGSLFFVIVTTKKDYYSRSSVIFKRKNCSTNIQVTKRVGVRKWERVGERVSYSTSISKGK